jgi:hypothetical protein
VAHTHEFEFGSAVLFLDHDRSVHWGDSRRVAGGTRSVTLYVKSPGDMFQIGVVGHVQKRAKKAIEIVPNASLGVVNLKSITIYDNSIRCYDDGVEVARDFINAFNEQYKETMAAAEQHKQPN